MNKRSKSHSVDTVFVLTLFCVFAISALLVLVFGAKAYSAIRKDADESYACRTALSFIGEKLRHGDESGSVSLGEHCGQPALVIGETYNDVQYNTYIYYYDGHIYELLCRTGIELEIDSGNVIISAYALHFEQKGENLLKINYTDTTGLSQSLLISLRSKEALS